MNGELLRYSLIMLGGVFASAAAQVLLKKSAMRTYGSKIGEYLNLYVIAAYLIFFGATFCTIYAYKVVPLSLGPVLEAAGYIFVTVFGVLIFGERITRRKLTALAMIILGIVICSLC